MILADDSCRWRMPVLWYSHHVFPSGTLAITVSRLFLCCWGPLLWAVWTCSSCEVGGVSCIWFSLPCIWIVWGSDSMTPASLNGALLRRSGSCSLASSSPLTVHTVYGLCWQCQIACMVYLLVGVFLYPSSVSDLAPNFCALNSLGYIHWWILEKFLTIEFSRTLVYQVVC